MKMMILYHKLSTPKTNGLITIPYIIESHVIKAQDEMAYRSHCHGDNDNALTMMN